MSKTQIFLAQTGIRHLRPIASADGHPADEAHLPLHPGGVAEDGGWGHECLVTSPLLLSSGLENILVLRNDLFGTATRVSGED